MTDQDARHSKDMEQRGNDELLYGGICPVCDEEFDDGWARMEEFEGESIEGVKICVVSHPDSALMHLPEGFDDDG